MSLTTNHQIPEILPAAWAKARQPLHPLAASMSEPTPTQSAHSTGAPQDAYAYKEFAEKGSELYAQA